MKNFIIFLSLFKILFAQFSDPAQFSVSADNVNKGEAALIQVKADLEFSWRIYAVYDVPEGPSSTKFDIDSEFIKNIGTIIEPEPTEKFDEGFGNVTKYHEGSPIFTIPLMLDENIDLGEKSIDVLIDYQVCNDNLCYPPNQIVKTVSFDLLSNEVRQEKNLSNFNFANPSLFSRLGFDENDFMNLILTSLIAGFAALLTPCVFPMIPITISFFLKRSENKKTSPVKDASVYMLGIVMTFTLLGVLLAIVLGASGATQLASNPYVNLFIAFLFVYFAFSLFGFYEIEIPQVLKRFSLERENSEGFAGILFMALTFTLTSFTCTVAFMGTVLVVASQGDWFWPVIGMLIFSLAFASPFFFLALFPHYLSKLPQSGGWLNSVKVIMGFLEIAAALKFISNTDLVWNWDIFTYEVVLYLWALIMLLSGLYIFGYIKFKNDSSISLNKTRFAIGLSFFIFAFYLASGNLGYQINGTIESYLPPKKYRTNLIWNNNLDDAFKIANSENKKIFIDFTGVTCTNCRWMETNIFSDKSVEELMSKFVLVSLYTDAGENFLEKREYQISRFETAALPYYVILSKKDRVIAEFPGLTRDSEKFKEFLKLGLNDKGTF